MALWVGGVNEKYSRNNNDGGTASSKTEKLLNVLHVDNNGTNKVVGYNKDSVREKTQAVPLNKNISSDRKRILKKSRDRKKIDFKNFTSNDGLVAYSNNPTLPNAECSPIKIGNNSVEIPFAKTSKSVAAEKKDTTVHEDEAEKKDEDNDVKLQAGLQWSKQVPFAGADNYFIGPNGASQPYRVLLPGAWLSLQADRYLFMAEVNPFATTLFNPKPFVTIINQVNNGQTTQTETRSLAKLFGTSAAIRTDYNIAGNWWAGAGIQANFWSKGVRNNYYTQTGGGNTTQFKTTTSLSDSDWVYFFKMQVRGDAELMYKTPYWHVGIRTGLFLMPIAQNYGGPKSPLQTELFYRGVLFNRKQHKSIK
jgi:hypothetical protein